MMRFIIILLQSGIVIINGDHSVFFCGPGAEAVPRILQAAAFRSFPVIHKNNILNIKSFKVVTKSVAVIMLTQKTARMEETCRLNEKQGGQQQKGEDFVHKRGPFPVPFIQKNGEKENGGNHCRKIIPVFHSSIGGIITGITYEQNQQVKGNHSNEILLQ